MLRQADEWSSDYRFWSCADIDVRKRKDFKETCSRNGKYFPSRCKCEKNYYGPQCQYKDECSNNQDCGSQGICIDLQGTVLPRKQCYCKFGWFGRGCNKRSPYKSNDIDLSGYMMKELSPDYKMYWRLLETQQEIEVILKVNSTTWVAMGWRPLTMTKKCKSFPLIQDLNSGNSKSTVNLAPESMEESAPEPTAEPEPESAPEPEPPTAEPEPISQPEPKSEPEPSSEPSKHKRLVENDENYPTMGVSSIARSVSYRVSTSSGRKRRDVEGKHNNIQTFVFIKRFD